MPEHHDQIKHWPLHCMYMSAMDPSHICLVAHFAYGALAGGEHGHIGGVERQTSLMAKWLAGTDRVLRPCACGLSS